MGANDIQTVINRGSFGFLRRDDESESALEGGVGELSDVVRTGLAAYFGGGGKVSTFSLFSFGSGVGGSGRMVASPCVVLLLGEVVPEAANDFLSDLGEGNGRTNSVGAVGVVGRARANPHVSFALW